MATKKFIRSVIEALFLDEDVDGIEYIETTKWEDDGKYQYCTIIFKDLSDNKIYSAGVTRCGSYFSDYDFQFEDNCHEVEKREKVISVWEIIK